MSIKTKTLKAAAKRFKINGSGHVIRKQAGMRHILTTKSAKRKRKLQLAESLKPCDLMRLNRMLPNG